MINHGSRGSAILAGRATSQQDRDAKATAYEAATIGAMLRAGQPPICAHDWTRDPVRLDPSLDNAARAAIQEAGQRACRLAQLAALAAE